MCDSVPAQADPPTHPLPGTFDTVGRFLFLQGHDSYRTPVFALCQRRPVGNLTKSGASISAVTKVAKQGTARYSWVSFHCTALQWQTGLFTTLLGP